MILGQDKPSLEELAHYGIKGMKWGVIRSEQQLSTEVRTIKRGTEFQNVSAGKAVDVGDRRVFTSHNTKDNLAYRSTYARVLKAMTNDADTYTNKLVATRDLKVASEKEAFDAFRKMYDADRVGMTKALSESYEATTRQMFGGGNVKDQKLIDDNFKRYSKKGDRWINKQGYDLFVTAAGTDLVQRDIADRYYTSLAKRGFDAMVDETDKKAGLSDDPIVVLKGRGSLKLKNTVPLTPEDIKIARQLYKQEKKRVKTEAKVARS